MVPGGIEAFWAETRPHGVSSGPELLSFLPRSLSFLPRSVSSFPRNETPARHPRPPTQVRTREGHRPALNLKVPRASPSSPRQQSHHGKLQEPCKEWDPLDGVSAAGFVHPHDDNKENKPASRKVVPSLEPRCWPGDMRPSAPSRTLTAFFEKLLQIFRSGKHRLGLRDNLLTSLNTPAEDQLLVTTAVVTTSPCNIK